VEELSLDITVPLRAFALELALEIGGQSVALVGPSGAGKSTVLRAIAGLIRPERGTISLGGRVLFSGVDRIDLPPEEREVGLVFQDYALFPHLTVRENVEYGGKGRVDELLARFRIDHLQGARPGKLSGGERQRVALARALAREPRVLLLDEPLAALDASTKATVRGELRDLLRDLGLPTLLVTHDFEDAAVLAAQVGVIVDGRLVQLASPAELVAAPASPFVANLTGANVLEGNARSHGDLTEIVLDDGSIAHSTSPGSGRVAIVVYPWEVSISREPDTGAALNHVAGPIASLVEVGNRARVRIGALTAEVTRESVARLGLAEGVHAVASFKATATRVLPFGPARGRPSR
jgi:molybdate transport system ATP-binding protein